MPIESKTFVKTGFDHIGRMVEQKNKVIRRAWDLTEPTDYGPEPRWFRKAASLAGKAGRLPKLERGQYVTMQLHAAGYNRILDHIGIVRENCERHVIFEPYERSCNIDQARRIAAELAEKLQCQAGVSMISWHYPGSTIRITLSPLPTNVKDATDASVEREPTPVNTIREVASSRVWDLPIESPS